jgi:hypothetical protein
MKYNITNKIGNSCIIELVSQTQEEEKLLLDKAEQYTFYFHYQTALEQKVHPNATFLTIMDDRNYPKIVTIKFEIVKGIGE